LITARLTGGLGNQMFVYAAARRLALHRGSGVCLDLELFARAGSRKYIHELELPLLSTEKFTIPGPLSRLRLHVVRAAARRLHGFGLGLPFVFWEKGPDFDPAVLGLPDGTTLFGYFQSERYFADIAETIRSEFQPRDPGVVLRVEATLAAIRRAGRDLVSLHVRRANYITVKADGSLVVPPAKVRSAMARFADADFLVFSDDLAWCRENIQGKNVRYSPFKTGVEDLAAMARCDHHILANSTFSWWGAWLNPSPNKIVIAPANWHSPDSDQPDGIRDLCPPAWIRA
jgi:hypothetical protein